VLRPALDVPYPLPPQLPLEFRLPPPRRVLPPLVGQDFLRRPVRRDAPRHRLHHQVAPLMVRQRVRHHEARVVVHEYRQVQPLLAPQQKREDVRLPKLIRPRSLEAPRRMLTSPSLRRLTEQAGFAENPPHLVLAHPQSLEALKRIAHPPRPVLRMRRLHLEHRLPLHRRTRLRLAHRRHHRLRHQRLHAPLSIGLEPPPNRVLHRSKHPRHLRQARPPLHLLHRLEPQRHRVRPLRPRRPPTTRLPLLTRSRPLLTSSLAISVSPFR
jgi:hypothetical protein